MIPQRSLIVLLTLLALVLSAAPPALTPKLLNLNDTTLLTNPFNQTTTDNDTTLLTNPFNLTTTDTAETYKCSEKRFMRTDRRPTFAECYRATRELPDTSGSGTFHTSGYNDVWRLPRVESFGQCRVKVDIEPRARVAGSWTAVKLTLDRLGILCRRSTSEGPERVAGWMLMGEGNKMKVSFLKPHHDPGPEVAEAWNETATE